MDKKTEALKLALEALEYINEGANNQGPHTGISWRCVSNKAEPTITAIREALADSALERMAENARELGLDYEPIVEQVEDFVGMGHGAWDMVDPKELAKGFHEALAEPPCKTGSQCTNKCQQCEQPAQQQEPVAWVGSLKDPQPHCVTDLKYCSAAQWDTGYHLKYIPLYTSPPARKPWVGLSTSDLDEIDAPIRERGSATIAEIYRAIEAKLREKNNG